MFFERKKVCNNGRARYQVDLAQATKSPVSKEFATAVCRLPVKYDKNAYFRFTENWGTVSMLIMK